MISLEQAAELKRLLNVVEVDDDKYKLEARVAMHAYIDSLTQPSEQRELTDKMVCPKCKQLWADHDFGVPAPFCPDPIQDRAVIAADRAKRGTA